MAVDAATESRQGDSAPATASGRDVARNAALATAAGIAVVAIAIGLWKVRTIIILLLLALTFAAAIRPGVEWLTRRGVPQAAAILVFFLGVLGTLGLFFWLAVPPALHQLEHLLNQPATNGVAVRDSTGIRHDVLVWVNTHLHQLPHGSDLLHPVASYGRKATTAVVGLLFTLAATWYWISERDRMIELLSAVAPESKREKARQTFLAIDHRLGSYTRLKFMMVAIVGAVLAAGFYLIGLHYWLLLGGFVALLEIIPVVGPLIGAILVGGVGLSQSVHVAALALLLVVGVRMFQSYVVNPHLMGQSVGLSPLVTLVSVSVVGLLFGGFAVVLAIPVTSAVATLIDVLVLDHEAPAEPAARRGVLSSRVRSLIRAATRRSRRFWEMRRAG